MFTENYFEAGDVITHLNGIPTPTFAEYGRVMDRLLYSSSANGTGVDYNVWRRGRSSGIG